jgi:putative tricarboxylic transport membrane protein
MTEPEDKAASSVKTMEIVVAAIIFLLGAVVMNDSVRLGYKWADDGPQAGYFPFYIGLIICIASVANIVAAVRKAGLGDKVFVTRGQLKLVMAVLVPTVVYTLLIKPLGIYLASALFIGFFMKFLGKYGALKIALVSLGTVVVFFVLFEIWFKVPLPKSFIEAALGWA